MARNTATKTGRKGPLRDAKTGRVRGGNPGNKGGTGRPPDEFKAMLRELASREATLEAVRKILHDDGHPLFMHALKWATEHGYGKPAQPVEHGGKDGGPMALTVRFVHE